MYDIMLGRFYEDNRYPFNLIVRAATESKLINFVFQTGIYGFQDLWSVSDVLIG